MMLAANGELYGITQNGGAMDRGTVFSFVLGGPISLLHNFGNGDGAYPRGALVEASDGNFYGTTTNGGDRGDGTVFRMTSNGTITLLHSFTDSGDEGTRPIAGLVEASDGNFYGTTSYIGSVYKITPGGSLTTLYVFHGNDGQFPIGGVIQATDGNFYGMTEGGGANDDGTIFKMTPGGVLSTLYNFSGPDGYSPFGGLLQATDGSFYGATKLGGMASGKGAGTLFRFSVGLAPFVRTLPSSAKVGTTISVIGTNLTGATAVTFNGRAAEFSVVSPTQITATVPHGASTGSIRVTLPGGTLTSSVPFGIRPVISSFAPVSGPAGTIVVITGISLTGSVKVSFGNVTAASFSVDSDTQITARAPTGARTGRIQISTLGGQGVSPGTFTTITTDEWPD
jgi:uncharacterized repeat protein (TIGR03803 family)